MMGSRGPSEGNACCPSTSQHTGLGEWSLTRSRPGGQTQRVKTLTEQQTKDLRGRGNREEARHLILSGTPTGVSGGREAEGEELKHLSPRTLSPAPGSVCQYALYSQHLSFFYPKHPSHRTGLPDVCLSPGWLLLEARDRAFWPFIPRTSTCTW